MLEPVPDTPFLYSKRSHLLVAADLHIGIGREMTEAGISVPRQWPQMAERILHTAEQMGAKRVLLLGDVKHKVPVASYSEARDIPLFFNRLLDHLDVEVVPGNHDGYLDKLLPSDVKLHSSKGVRKGSTGFFHGHSWPSDNVFSADLLVMGHMHPSISLTDDIGTSTIMPCWVRAKIDESETIKKRYKKTIARASELIIMPASSSLRRGTPVNRGRWLGPLTRSDAVNKEEAGVYLLDGTFLGNVGSIPTPPREIQEHRGRW